MPCLCFSSPRDKHTRSSSADFDVARSEVAAKEKSSSGPVSFPKLLWQRKLTVRKSSQLVVYFYSCHISNVSSVAFVLFDVSLWSSKASELGLGDLGASSETKPIEKTPPGSAATGQKEAVVEENPSVKSVDSAADLDSLKPAGMCVVLWIFVV